MPALLARFTPHIGLAALLTIAALGLALKLQTTRLTAARAELKLEKALHDTTKASFAAAQARANADWQARLARMAALSRRQKDDADDKADAARTLYLDRVLRLPAAPADPGDARQPGLPGAGPPARADRSGGDTVLLARADALICATNTARLAAAHDWANALAVASGDPGKARAPR